VHARSTTGNITGISLSSFFLSCLGYTVNFAYSRAQGYPLSTYGENALLMVQDFVIIALLLRFSASSSAGTTGALALAVYAAIVGCLFSGVVPASVWTFLQSANIVIFCCSKVTCASDPHPSIVTDSNLLHFPSSGPTDPDEFQK
jgi:mannose-P-dolichol utilization defect protein 1